MISDATGLAVQDQDLDLLQLFGRLWRARAWIGVSVVTFVVLFAAVALLMQPVYRATVTLAPADTHDAASLGSGLGPLGGLAASAGVDISGLGDTRTQEALAVLKSREFTEQFIDERNLLPELYSQCYDTDKQEWTVAADRRPTLPQAYKYFNEIRTAAIDQKTGLIKVQIDWRDPRQAAIWANDLVARLNKVMRRRAIDRSSVYIDYLQSELKTTPEVTARAAIGRLIEAQIHERMLASVTDEYALRVIDRALIPDPNEPLRPKRLLLVMLGGLVGMFVGMSGVFVYDVSRRQHETRAGIDPQPFITQ